MAKIFVVDDDELAVELYKIGLRPHAVIIETNPEKAIKRIIQEKPDVVISDTDFPQKFGYEIMDSVREMRYNCPFIGVSLEDDTGVKRQEWVGRHAYFVLKGNTLDDIRKNIGPLVEEALQKYRI